MPKSYLTAEEEANRSKEQCYDLGYTRGREDGLAASAGPTEDTSQAAVTAKWKAEHDGESPTPEQIVEAMKAARGTTPVGGEANLPSTQAPATGNDESSVAQG